MTNHAELIKRLEKRKVWAQNQANMGAGMHIVVGELQEAIAALEVQSRWVKIEDIEKHFNFDEIEPYAVNGPCVAVTSMDGVWEMVRLTRHTDIEQDREPDIPTFTTFGSYVDNEFIKDTCFTHFMKIEVPQHPTEEGG